MIESLVHVSSEFRMVAMMLGGMHIPQRLVSQCFLDDVVEEVARGWWVLGVGGRHCRWLC